MGSVLAETLGRQLLHSDIWFLADKCANLVKRIHEPLERSVAVLDNILTLEDDDTNRSVNAAVAHPNLLRNNVYGLYPERVNGQRNMDNNNEAIDDYNNRQFFEETLNNGPASPPHNISFNPGPHQAQQQQRENMQITQPCSPSSSPLASPNALGHFLQNNGVVAAAATSSTLCSSGSAATASTSSSSSSSSSSGSAHSHTHTQLALVTANVTDTADPNWQANKGSVRERNAAMFNNDLMADIKFIVGAEDQIQTIPAHKYVLATGSSVFYAMFYGGLAEDKEEIRVPDVEPTAFLTLLRYMYCDEILLEPDNVLSTLYVAKKYIVPHLARAAVNFLESSLTAKNACLLLSQSRLFEEPELMQRCWEVIDAQAEMAIKSEGFVDIDLKTFESILSRDTLNCKEINLFEAALVWAHFTCQKMDIDPTPNNKRKVLGSALRMIRMPTMSLEEFANGVAQSGILTPQETIDIFLHFTAHRKPGLDFSIKPRSGLKMQVCHRFQSCAYRSNQWRYRGRCDSIQFSVDKRVFVVGFGLYGSSTGAADYSVKIELKRLGCVLAENHTKFFSDGSSTTFHVFFEHPIQVEADCYYTASVILDGSELSFFGQEGMSEVCMGNVTFQFQCSSESTNGTGVQGGQIPELIFFGPSQATSDNTKAVQGAAGCVTAGGGAIGQGGSVASGNSVANGAGRNSEPSSGSESPPATTVSGQEGGLLQPVTMIHGSALGIDLHKP